MLDGDGLALTCLALARNSLNNNVWCWDTKMLEKLICLL